ncbi:hypothetical protein CCR75_001478 [Bremia lactucae]|uniref:Uncharacterized protein n=1 Tax=Bremia lactucae TaxID=4779 RepID=A0A976P0J3_BRELC|nr:hypothetical protein CCR75_001478 [Bremia lactucae]
MSELHAIPGIIKIWPWSQVDVIPPAPFPAKRFSCPLRTALNLANAPVFLQNTINTLHFRSRYLLRVHKQRTTESEFAEDFAVFKVR